MPRAFSMARLRGGSRRCRSRRSAVSSQRPVGSWGVLASKEVRDDIAPIDPRLVHALVGRTLARGAPGAEPDELQLRDRGPTPQPRTAQLAHDPVPFPRLGPPSA